MPFSCVLPISIESPPQDIFLNQFMLQIILVGVAFIRVTLIMQQKCGPFAHKSVARKLLWLGFHVLNVVIDDYPFDTPLVSFF
jgi:hypothetical protein